MEATIVKGCVSGPIEGKERKGKGMFVFKVHQILFTLPEKTTFVKRIKGAARAIVVYEQTDGEVLPRVTEVICNYTVQQLLQVHAKYSD